MNDQLRITLDELEASGRKVNVFFRNDNVDQDEESLRRLLELFILEQIPVNMGVIPGLLTDEAIKLLKEFQSPLFDLNQHGWQHVNHERQGPQFEFGSSRTFQEQFVDIAR